MCGVCTASRRRPSLVGASHRCRTPRVAPRGGQTQPAVSGRVAAATSASCAPSGPERTVSSPLPRRRRRAPRARSGCRPGRRARGDGAVAAALDVGQQRPCVGQHGVGRTRHFVPRLGRVGLEACETMARAAFGDDTDHGQRQVQQTDMSGQPRRRYPTCGAALPDPAPAAGGASANAAMPGGRRRCRIQTFAEQRRRRGIERRRPQCGSRS